MNRGGFALAFGIPPSAGGLYQPYILARSSIPFISVSSGSMGNNGALTGITALSVTYAQCYLFLPANAISAGSAAGWYYAQMSSTTAGTVFNNTYTTGVPTVPSVPTAFATTGPGAFTGDTTEQGVTIPVPANALGPNGVLVSEAYLIHNSNANAKTIRHRYDGAAGTNFFSGNGASATGSKTYSYIRNRSATNSQFGWGDGFNSASGSYGIVPQYTAIDTSVATNLVLTMQKATATDNIVLESFLLQLLYGA